MTKNMEKTKFTMAAIDPYIQTNIISPTETELRHQSFVEFGERNEYPNYIASLYDGCATLSSIINGTADYVCGDSITSNIDVMSNNQVESLVRDIALDILIYGGAYIEVLRNKLGKIVQLNTLNFRNVRSNGDNTKFYYSKGFGDSKSYGRCKCKVYDKFDPDKMQAQSIYMIKNNKHQVYPQPIWKSAVIAAEIEKNINQYHLNNLINGFTSYTIVGFNNGIPEDDIKEEIERNFNEKFTGTHNAGRVMLSWSDDKEHAATIDTIELKDYGEQYKTLAERSRSEIFCSFRAVPNLFGIMDQTTGFNSQEFGSAFKLYNKTVVFPIQKSITRALENIFIIDNPVTIQPFQINFDEV